MGLILLMCLCVNTEVTCGKCSLKDGYFQWPTWGPSLEKSKKVHVQALYFWVEQDDLVDADTLVKAYTDVPYFTKGCDIAKEVEESFLAP